MAGNAYVKHTHKGALFHYGGSEPLLLVEALPQSPQDTIKCIQPLSGEKPSALQLAARREKEKPSIRAQLQASKAEQGQMPPAREKSKGLEVE